jgi:hypothetical protein
MKITNNKQQPLRKERQKKTATTAIIITKVVLCDNPPAEVEGGKEGDKVGVNNTFPI